MTAVGTFACPICGKDAPHTHSGAEVEQHRDLELWVERSWQDMRQMMDAAARGDWKPPLSCGCEDADGQSDLECPFCGDPTPSHREG